jgi:hypothetical protein
MLTSGKGKYKVWLEQKKIGDDLVYFLGGGEKSHIGCVVICEPFKKTKITKFKGHFDHVVLTPIAEAACEKYKNKVVVIGGIHIDNANKNELDILVENCRALIKKL